MCKEVKKMERMLGSKFNRVNRERNYYHVEDTLQSICDKKKDYVKSAPDFVKDKFLKSEEWSIKSIQLSRKGTLSTRPKRGEIWFMDFGVNLGSEVEKSRPCIIVSNEMFNGRSTLCTVVPITTKHKGRDYDSQFEIDSSCIYESNMDVYGVASAEQVLTRDQRRLEMKIGSLNEKGLKLLDESMLTHLSICMPNVEAVNQQVI